jgi:membrane associated rhomboid family serine protease
MIPISDVIPTRTPPIITITVIAASILVGLLVSLGGVASLAANMLCLWLFGWTVEDRLGHARFAVLVLCCAAAAWLLATHHAIVAGGVAGVIGGYFVLYPKSSMLVLVPIPLMLAEVPAVTFLALWLVSQLVFGPCPLVGQIAGFLIGALLSVLIRRPERLQVEWWSPSSAVLNTLREYDRGPDDFRGEPPKT